MDRKFFSRFSSGGIALQIHQGGTLTDAEGPVTWSQQRLHSEQEVVASGTATRVALGTYVADLDSQATSTEGLYDVLWDYALSGKPQRYATEIEVGPLSPDYDALPMEWRVVVDSVWLRFADLFDAPFGGPHLQTYRANNFGRNRLAQLLSVALQRLNSVTSGHVTRELGKSFPFKEWGGVLEKALYIEVLKHFVRSFVEQPEAILGTQVSRVDRRDYMNRWQQVLDGEQREFEREISQYRMAHIGLGGSSLLVSGGVYGNHGPTFAGAGGSGAARGYYPVRRFH